MNTRGSIAILLALVTTPGLASADVVKVFGEEVHGSWAQCPFTLLMAQRQANRQLDLDLDGEIVLSGAAAPRVDYKVKLRHGSLHVSVAASMKSHEFATWHPPDTAPSRHELQLDAPGLLATIQADDLASPLVAVFKSAVEECVGGAPAR
jgi:hypothetical protein